MESFSSQDDDPSSVSPNKARRTQRPSLEALAARPLVILTTSTRCYHRQIHHSERFEAVWRKTHPRR